MTSRVTRSRARPQHEEPTVLAKFDRPILAPLPAASPRASYRLKRTTGKTLKSLPEVLTTGNTALDRDDLRTLRANHKKLLSPNSQTASFIAELPAGAVSTPNLTAAAQATLVFAQFEAGTAVCISPTGLLLTCAHCVAESQAEYKADKPQWLIFSTGRAVKAECVAWDPRRDLALLQVMATAAKPESSLLLSSHASSLSSSHPALLPSSLSSFPFASIASANFLKKDTRLFCIGHPGSEDLESTSGPKAINYDVLHVSSGRYRGLAADQDVQDNAEIGALMHDCWTYWGHSGAPLIYAKTGELVGLHSSWDDETGIRRGVALEAITAFLEEHCMKNTVA